jgi:hypothetical protein
MNRDFYRVPCGKHLMVNSKIISLFVLKRLFNKNSIDSFLLCCDPFFHSAGKFVFVSGCRTTKLLISELSLDKSCTLDIFLVGSYFLTSIGRGCGKRHTEKNVKEKYKNTLFLFFFFGLTSTQARLPAEFKHIIKRRKRN